MPEHKKAIKDADLVMAPDLIVCGVTNAVWKYHEFEKLEVEACQKILEISLGLVDTLIQSIEICREAFLGARTEHCSAYDMFYLTLARREDALLITVDQPMRKLAKRLGIAVV